MNIRNASNVHGPQWLDFAEAIVMSIGHAESPRDADRRRKLGRSAGLWTKDVPKSRTVVNLARSYGESGGLLKLEANDIEIGSVSISGTAPIVTDDGVSIYLTYSLFGGDSTEKIVTIPYRNHIQRLICTGQWISLNIGQVRFGSLIPRVDWDGSAVRLSWSDPPQLQLGNAGILGLNLMRRMTDTTLSAVVIGKDYGDFETSGVIGWGLPRLKWMD